MYIYIYIYGKLPIYILFFRACVLPYNRHISLIVMDEHSSSIAGGRFSCAVRNVPGEMCSAPWVTCLPSPWSGKWCRTPHETPSRASHDFSSSVHLGCVLSRVPVWIRLLRRVLILLRPGGDDTVRTRVYDLAAAARPNDPVCWPEPYDSSGVAKNVFTRRWNSREEALEKELSIRYVLHHRSVGRAGFLALGRVWMKQGLRR